MKRKQRMRGELKGSFTLELALLVPTILFSLCSIFYLGFYLYDYHKVNAVVEEAIGKTSMFMKHESNIDTGDIVYSRINQHYLWELHNGDRTQQEIKLEQYLEKKVREKYFLFKDLSVDTAIGINRIDIKISGKVHSRIPFSEYLFPSPVVVSQSKIHNPTLTIRQGDIILQTGKKIKGVEEFMNKLEEFLQ